ncbi:MAG: hypothetical protein LLG37_03305, partial [Spirochaetia bacterium]|nr:hypothetical protein [Spirochaetia bacterium]
KLLFHNIFIVENITKAREVLAAVRKESQYYLLTLNGELVSNYNIYTKGEGLAGEGFLSRDREIAEIESEIGSASGRLAAIGEEKAFQISKIENLEKEIEQLSVTYHNQYVEVIKDDERIKQKNEDVERHKSDIKRIEEELLKLEAEKQSYEAGRQALTLEEGRIIASLDVLKAEFEAIKQDIAKREGEIAAERALIEAKRLEIGSLSGEFDIEKNNKQMLETRLAELQSAYDSTAAQIEELNARVRATDDEAKANDARINEFKGSLAGDEAALEAVKKEHDEFNVKMKTLEDDIKKMSKLRDRLKDEQYDIKIKINEMDTSIKVIYEKLMLDFKVRPTEDEVYAVEVTPDEYTELSVKVGEFREKMERLGVVNMVAIEEYNELKSRSEHLQTQYDDLNTARENLKKIIKKANEESKTLFAEAFAGIRLKFADVFTKMMNGGEADLVLSDAENMLESGIDIIARPPGKKLQNISLLSGGEKAITAVSLLFALFLTKASPFCIMDEIDAPLDDVNVTRFTNLVKSFKKTQFIIISHNKLTMEIGEVLYGVTMAKAGVSQIISVKMEKDREKVKSLLEHDGKSKAAEEFEEKQKEHAEEAKEKAGEADGEK